MENQTDILKYPKPPSNVDVMYLGRSEKELIVLTLLTGGGYHVYWHYKNWKCRKLALGSNIHPIVRGFFSIFYCHTLFEKIHLSASKHGDDSLSNHNTLATQYVVIALLNAAVNKFAGAFASQFVMWLSLIPLLKVQRAINFNNSHVSQNEEVEAPDFSPGEWAVVIIFSLLNVFSLGAWFYFKIHQRMSHG